MAQVSRDEKRRRIHHRVRQTLIGTPDRPRLCVYRSLKHIYVQLVDDLNGRTLATVSTVKVNGKKLEKGGNVEAAKKVGQIVAEKAQEKGIEAVVFDRGGYLYHGRVKALAEAARKAGLKF